MRLFRFVRGQGALMSVGITLRAAGQTRQWSRRAIVVAGSILSLLLARDAAALCQNGAATQPVNPGDNLTQIIQDSTATCTLNVNPGTYDAGFNSQTVGAPFAFRISSPITIRSTGGPNSTTLRVAAGIAYVVEMRALNGRCPSGGATLDGFKVTGGNNGVLVQALSLGICASDQITGITLRNLIVDTPSTAAGGNAITFGSVQNSVIDSCTVTSAYANGIFLSGTSNNNIVMNNTIQNTVTQHGIAVQGSSDNVIVGNTITGSAFDGIILNSASPDFSLAAAGSARNRVERNTISGHATDGITLTANSSFNYLGQNFILSSSYDPVTKPTPSPTSGVGLWINNNSNGNYLFGNDLAGSPENGIDVLTSTSTYIQANRVHANFGGGIWVANYQFAADPASPATRDTVVHGNNVFFNTSNAQINLEGTVNVDVAYNHLAGDQGGVLAGVNTGGVLIHETGAPSQRPGVATSSVNLYENTFTDLNNRAFVNATTASTQFFRNRFLNGSNNPNAPLGRQGLTYSFSPAGVQWDASRFLGGNHWSDFSATGNPDPAHQYRGFVYDAVHGIDGNGPYADKFPYQSEHLGAPYATFSVNVTEPIAGSVLAAGSRKTVSWIARGCVTVDLHYARGAGATTYIGRYPNVGHYVWTVPILALHRPTITTSWLSALIRTAGRRPACKATAPLSLLPRTISR